MSKTHRIDVIVVVTIVGGSRVSFLERTGQRWKVAFFAGALLTSGILLALMIWRANDSVSLPQIPGEDVFSLGGVGMAVIAFGWLWLSVRCPRCGARVAGIILKHEAATRWLRSLVEVAECPVCRFTGDSPYRLHR